MTQATASADLPLPLLGGCLCGAVRYQVAAAPVAVYLCHCKDCQRRTGSAFAMAMLVKAADFSLSKNHLITRKTEKPDGSHSLRHYCADCLVRTHTTFSKRPNLTSVRPGTLDEPSLVSPTHQLWTKSAHPWALASQLDSFAGDFE
jgi:hypothetical protein